MRHHCRQQSSVAASCRTLPLRRQSPCHYGAIGRKSDPHRVTSVANVAVCPSNAVAFCGCPRMIGGATSAAARTAALASSKPGPHWPTNPPRRRHLRPDAGDVVNDEVTNLRRRCVRKHRFDQRSHSRDLRVAALVPITPDVGGPGTRCHPGHRRCSVSCFRTGWSTRCNTQTSLRSSVGPPLPSTIGGPPPGALIDRPRIGAALAADVGVVGILAIDRVRGYRDHTGAVRRRREAGCALIAGSCHHNAPRCDCCVHSALHASPSRWHHRLDSG